MKKQNNNKGVTLLELMVAVSLFTVTILISTQIFKAVLDGQRQAVASQNMQENLRYSFERMSKEIRMAKKSETSACAGLNNIYKITAGGTTGNDLVFLNYRGDCIRYFLENNRLKVRRLPAGGAPSDEHEDYITPASLEVSKLKFAIIPNSETAQAAVRMRLHMEVNIKNGIKQKIDIQTTLSSRFYE